jgi:hypothetical protein
MEIKELVKQLNDLKIIQQSFDFVEDLPEEFQKYFPANSIACELDIDKHRWYETSMSIWEVEEYNDLIGVRAITNLYSEMSEYSDICWELMFFEVEEVQTITYKEKII